MQIKKELPLFLLLASLFTALLINARATNDACISAQPNESSSQCNPNQDVLKSVTPLNFITKGIFHIPS